MPGERNGGAVAEPAEEPMWDDWADAEEPVNGNGNGNGVVAPPVNGNGTAPPVDDPAGRVAARHALAARRRTTTPAPTPPARPSPSR